MNNNNYIICAHLNVRFLHIKNNSKLDPELVHYFDNIVPDNLSNDLNSCM